MTPADTVPATATRRRPIWRHWLARSSPLLVTLAVLLVWEAGVRIGGVPAYLLPPPSAIAARIVKDYRLLATHMSVTAGEIMAGYLLAIAISIPLAAVLAQFRFVENALYPILVASQTVPKVAIAPILVVWFGFGLTPKVLIARPSSPSVRLTALVDPMRTTTAKTT